MQHNKPELLPDAGIYVITNRVNGKQYVGQSKDVETRWRDHFKSGKPSFTIHHAIQKHGPDNFDVEIIRYPGVTYEALNEIEKWKIRELGSLTPDGYNLTEGGLNGARSEETRKKMSETSARPEVKKRRSEAQKLVAARPGEKERRSEAQNRPEVKKRKSESLKATLARPEVKKRRSESIKEAMNRPEVKAKHKAAINRPEVKKRRSESIKATLARPKVKAKHKAAINRPEVKKRKSEAQKSVEARKRQNKLDKLPFTTEPFFEQIRDVERVKRVKHVDGDYTLCVKHHVLQNRPAYKFTIHYKNEEVVSYRCVIRNNDHETALKEVEHFILWGWDRRKDR